MSDRSHRPTRRSVVRAGAWTAPVIVAATAAPAVAASTTPRLTFSPGQTRFGETTLYTPGSQIMTVIFNQFFIVPSASSPDPLTFSVTHRGTGQLATNYTPAPAGWTRSGAGSTSIAWVYGGAVQAGQPILFGLEQGDGIYFDGASRSPIFDLFARVNSFEVATATYARPT